MNKSPFCGLAGEFSICFYFVAGQPPRGSKQSGKRLHNLSIRSQKPHPHHLGDEAGAAVSKALRLSGN